MNSTLFGQFTDLKLYNFYKGFLYAVSPLTVPLTLLILIQNSVILRYYYKIRSRFIPAMFMSMAAADLFNTQGQLVLSVISILVYKCGISRWALYRSVYYYMFTALPGMNCSSLMNLVQILYVTAKLVRPTRDFNEKLLKKVTRALCCVVTLLHAVDTVLAITASLTWEREQDELFVFHLNLLVMSVVPGLTTIVLSQQNLGGQSPNMNLIINTDLSTKLLVKNPQIIYCIAGAYLLLPPLMVLVCMAVQIVYLRRRLHYERSENTPLIPSTNNWKWKNIAMTVFLTAILFFTTRSVLPAEGLIWNVMISVTGKKKRSYFIGGVAYGCGLFVAPLVNNAVLSIIVIFRKPELRNQYVEFFIKLCTCSLCGNGSCLGLEESPYLSETPQNPRV